MLPILMQEISKIAAQTFAPSGKYLRYQLPTSYSKINIPANGWLEFTATATASSGYIYLRGHLQSTCISVVSGNLLCTYLPVAKNSSVTVGYSNINPASASLIFYYSQDTI
jgi:hypothetical protein